jgi:phosphoribosylformimino-5-aminoimidazole carboxamide ribotide isomerase
VLDLQQGQVVRGIGGRRAEYLPIVSRLTTSSEPIAVAEALRRTYGLSELYVADLDAIAGARPAFGLYENLHALGFRLWVDAGIRVQADAQALAAAHVESIVAGLETLEGIAELTNLCARFSAERVVFSMDLKGGRPLGKCFEGSETDGWAIAEAAIKAGVRRLLILDLARVGTGTGPGTEALCKRLAQHYPDVELAAGGGLRDRSDLVRMIGCGVRSLLLASALHDGRILPEDLALDTAVT